MQRENRRIRVYDLTKFPLWDVYMLTLKEGKNDNDLWTNVNPKLHVGLLMRIRAQMQ